MGSKVGKILKTVAPIALGFVPGMQPLAAAAIGAGIGATGGGGLKGALLGGAGGYLGAGGLTSTAAGGLGNTALGKAASSLGSALGGSGAADKAFNSFLGGTGTATAANTAANAVGSGLLGGVSNAVNGLTGGAGTSGGGLLSGGNLLSAGANLYSGVQGASAAKKQTAAMASANKNALNLQAKMYDQTTANMSPFVTSGTSANTRLSDLLGGDPEQQRAILESSPGYQFRLNQGTKSMNQSLGARGSLFSGDALKAAQTFGQGLADQTYNDYVQQLQTAANAGQSAAANQGASSANYASNAGNLMNNAGNINASGMQAVNNVTNQSLANALGTNVGGFSGASLGNMSDEQLRLLMRQRGLM